MEVIYLDTLFLLNAVIDYMLLLCSARVAGERLRRGRFVLGALLGGGYAAALFLPGMWFLYHPACRFAAAVLMVLLAFSQSRRLVRQILIFFALACGFGGGVLATGMLAGQRLSLGGGIFYAPMDLKIVLVSAAACYGLFSLLFRKWGQHTAVRGELRQVKLRFQTGELSLTALVDTGNTLSDPVSGQSVMVAEGERLFPLFPRNWALEKWELKDPAGAMVRLGKLCPGRFRLLPYRAVGVERGLLLTARIDEVWIDNRMERDGLVALSPNPVSETGVYQILIGAEQGGVV